MTAEPSKSRTSPLARSIRVAGEVLLFVLLAFAPWPFASNDPRFESLLAIGVLLLCALWAVHAAVAVRLSIRWDAVTFGLLGLIFWTAFQLIPLPESIVGILSPTRLEWHRKYLPEQLERLAGEVSVQSRANYLTISVDPSVTRTFLVQLVQLGLVYMVVRNWLATRGGLRRLAWVMTATGATLSIFSLVQFFTSTPEMVYWTIPVQGAAYGPFICRNHFPDFAALCLGLTVGLLIPRAGQNRPSDDDSAAAFLSPRGLGLAAAAGLMIVGILFSLSRGGILAAVGAGIGSLSLVIFHRSRGPLQAGVFLAIAVAATVAIGLVGWLGQGAIQTRFDTLTAAETADTRSNLWRDAMRLVPEFWLAGTGGGTFVWVEPLVRTDRSSADLVDHAHNDYLEALLEGGVVRLGLTLLIVGALLVRIARGYLRRRDRSVGPFLLGLGFGLATVAIHAAGDFALHMPAVAILVAAAAGYAVAAATDPEFVPAMIRRSNRSESGATDSNPIEHSVSENSPNRSTVPVISKRKSLADWTVTVFSLVVVGSALVAAIDSSSRDRAYRLKLAADWVYAQQDRPGRLTERCRYLEAAVEIRPRDPELLFAAGQARIDAAVAAAVSDAGRPLATTGIAGDLFSKSVVDEHLVPALRYLRAARDANPIAPKPHTRLGLYTEVFEHSEPAAVHLDRAKQLLPRDPDLWYASGKLAYRRGDWNAAWSDWKRSLEIAPRHLSAILAASDEVLFTWQILTRVLPRDPATILAAADQLYPDRVAEAADRKLFLLAAIALGSQPDVKVDQLIAMARAYGELRNGELAEASWKRAMEMAPDQVSVREGYSTWLESEERYEEAVPQLEWLLTRNPDSKALQGRLEVAQHGRELSRALGR